MRNDKRYIVFVAVLGLLLFVRFALVGRIMTRVEQMPGASLPADDWGPVLAADSNQGMLTVAIDGKAYTNQQDGIYMEDSLQVMFPVDLLRDAFDCSAHLYEERRLMVEKREAVLQFELGGASSLLKKGMDFYIPAQDVAEGLGYTCQWDSEGNQMTIQSAPGNAGSILPRRYDLREKGRAPLVRDQGSYGTCWAFAALTALESALLPDTAVAFSVDHMNENNSFSGSKDGGQYTMAMAYLAAWQGPVYEADDPYGDGITDDTLTAVKHVQEMQILEEGDLEGIKKAVFQYGGVESCIYTTIQGASGDSSYYNSTQYAYCYTGDHKPNHDVVIIGWDDGYPKENFYTQVSEDGAFICQNSWGDDFGEGGIFYVSYEDANIGAHNLVYTGIEGVDNYDRLYQSDLCGWVGQMGYNKESIYGANVYTAQASEAIAAAGFYTTGRNTSYEVYLVPEFADAASLDQRMLAAKGEFAHAGYHTVRFAQPVRVEEGKKFAVVIWLSTPDAVHPMAIEYAADELTQEADLSDGEGYISADGHSWADAEEASQCNLCIKAYACRLDGP